MQTIDIINNNQIIILCRKFLNITRIFYNLYKIIKCKHHFLRYFISIFFNTFIDTITSKSNHLCIER